MLFYAATFSFKNLFAYSHIKNVFWSFAAAVKRISHIKIIKCWLTVAYDSKVLFTSYLAISKIEKL